MIGLSAAVVTPTGSWAGATGVDAAGTAIKPTSAFAIADITMTFVGAEVLLLASGGKIDLDAPVTTYVTLPFATNGATIRQLATMTSGFPGLPATGLLAKQVPKDLSMRGPPRSSSPSPRTSRGWGPSAVPACTTGSTTSCSGWSSRR